MTILHLMLFIFWCSCILTCNIYIIYNQYYTQKHLQYTQSAQFHY